MRRIVLLSPALFIGLYFFGFARWGLFADFTQDDLMNMYRSMVCSYSTLIGDNLIFWRFSPTFRPFGALLYKLSLDWFGLNLTAFSILRYASMCANLFLLYGLTRRLAGSREAGALAALLYAHHLAFSSLYFNTGTCYDIFCYFFFFSALLYYIRIRQSGRHLGVPHVLVFCALLVLALDAKEMAVVMPAIIGLYELLYHLPKTLNAWFGRVAVTPLVSGVIVLAYYFGRVNHKDGIAHVGGYRTVINLAGYLRQVGHYLIEALYQPDRTLPATVTTLFLVALFAIAALLRSKALAFSALLFTVGILPVAFIPWRGLNAVYIPLAGLAIFLAVLLVNARESLTERLGSPVEGKIVLFVVVASALMHLHPTAHGHYESWQRDEYANIRAVMDQMPQLHPHLKPGDRILVVKDPFKQFNWASLFIARLVYRDESLGVDRLVSMDHKPTATQVAEYNVRLAFEDGKLRDVPASQVPLGPD